MSINTVGIIGATSPLGTHLVDFLLKSGYNIHASYRIPDRVPNSWWDNSSITCAQADLEDKESLLPILPGCEVVIWLAHRNPGRLGKQEVELNTLPFRWVCDQLPLFNIGKLIFISSGGSVYGQSRLLPIPEDHPRNPLSSYGKAKKNMEDMLYSRANQLGLVAIIIRPGNIYGFNPLDTRAKGVIPAYYRSLRSEQSFMLVNHGNAIRDFVHVSDVVRAILCAIEFGKGHATWNVGTGIGIRVSNVVQLISQTIDLREPCVRNQPAHSTDVDTNVLCIENIYRECGWKPEVDIKRGIEGLTYEYKRQMG